MVPIRHHNDKECLSTFDCKQKMPDDKQKPLIIPPLEHNHCQHFCSRHMVNNTIDVINIKYGVMLYIWFCKALVF